MAKLNTSKATTVDGWYQGGKEYYLAGVDIEEGVEQGDPEQMQSYYVMAACQFWEALVLGHPQAPYSLAMCFNQGVGVTKNEYIANLLFGVALALNDPKCQDVIQEFSRPSGMDRAISDLTQLIKRVHSEIDIDSEVNVRLAENLQLFDSSIKLPGSQVMKSFFLKAMENQVTQDFDVGHSYQNNDTAIGVSGDLNGGDSGDCCNIL
jgi:hypothetical protein